MGIKTYKFGYDLSALTEYTEEQKLPLVMRSLYEAKTAQIFRVQPGIKYKDAINIMDDQLVIQDGDTCGFNPTGNTSFSQRDIVVANQKVDKSWCIQDLEKYWMQTQLTPGSTYNGIPFEQAFSEFMAGLIAQQNEINLWQSDTNAGGLYDGFLAIIDAEATVINGNTSSAASITTANVIGIFDDMMEVLPAELDSKPDLGFECGWDTFKTLIQALRDNNNFYYNGVEANPYKTGELTLPGWGVPVRALHGLDGLDRIILGRDGNFVIGTDQESDEDNFLFWMRDDKETFAFKARWKLGTQVAFPAEIVEFTTV